MRILGLMLENIRSFKKEIIVFPRRGVTTIHGDTGSGKTSILMAISAALFGLQLRSSDPFSAFAYPTGRDLLRADASTGVIRLLFQQGDKIYLVERVLRREGDDRVASANNRLEEYVVDKETGRLVRQNQWILSANDLNEKIKGILGIKETGREKKPLLFTSVLYAPQFNIHEILSLGSSERVEIIERSLGLSKYKEYRRNSDEVAEIIRNEIKGLSKSIEEKKAKLRTKNKEVLLREKRELEKEKEELEELLKTNETELEKLSGEIKETRDLLLKVKEEIAGLRSRIEMTERSKRRLEELRSELGKLLSSPGKDYVGNPDKLLEDLKLQEERLEREYSEKRMYEQRLEEEEDRLLRELEEKRKTQTDLQVELGKLESERQSRLNERSKLEKQAKEYRELLERGVCPLCRQPIPHDHGVKLVNDILAQINELDQRLVEISRRRSEIEEKVGRIKDEINGLKAEVERVRSERSKVGNEVRRLERELRNVQVLIERLNSIINELKRLEEEIARAGDLEKLLEDAYNREKSVQAKLSDLESRERKLHEEVRSLSSKIARITERIENLEKDIKDIEMDEEELKRLEDEKKFHEWMLNTINSIDKLVENVEKHVSLEMIQEFRRIFYTVLNTLMQGQPVEVKINDDFTIEPKIRIGEKTFLVSSLSGGQGIAISLAYRLALNATVRAYSPYLRKTVLILDEPTTGFSRELVVRLGEVLRKIGELEGQVIVVTHDEALKDVGDCKIALYRDPANHVSRVESYECSEVEGFNEYKEIVENILRGSYTRLIEGKPTQAAEPADTGFKPVVKLEPGSQQKARRSIFDYGRRGSG